jgi:hypothetical protein
MCVTWVLWARIDARGEVRMLVVIVVLNRGIRLLIVGLVVVVGIHGLVGHLGVGPVGSGVNRPVVGLRVMLAIVVAHGSGRLLLLLVHC